MNRIKTSKYVDHIYKTNGGILLYFNIYTEAWVGPYPGKDWDTHFDIDVPKYYSLPKECKEFPIIAIGPYATLCRPMVVSDDSEFHNLLMSGDYINAKKLITHAKCTNRINNYQYCSQKCWLIQELHVLKSVIKSKEEYSRF
jgi:hypothetical protein